MCASGSIARAAGGRDETLTGSKYLWLYAEENLPAKHRLAFEGLVARPLKTARAWAIKESPRDLWSYTHQGWALRRGKRWYLWATHSPASSDRRERPVLRQNPVRLP
jgi:transposase